MSPVNAGPVNTNSTNTRDKTDVVIFCMTLSFGWVDWRDNSGSIRCISSSPAGGELRAVSPVHRSRVGLVACAVSLPRTLPGRLSLDGQRDGWGMVCWTIPALYVAAEDHWLTTNPTEPSAVFAEKYHV